MGKVTKHQKRKLLKKLDELHDVSERFDDLFNEITCEWLKIETGVKHNSFWRYFKTCSGLKFCKDTLDRIRHEPINLPQDVDVLLSNFISDYCSYARVVPDCSHDRDGTYETFLSQEVSSVLGEYLETYLDKNTFDYYSPVFRKLRNEVFLRDGEKCAKCGAIPRPGLSLTIDHIKPVSIFPDSSMDINNLQVLCWECNQTKSNLHYKDYRTPSV